MTPPDNLQGAKWVPSHSRPTASKTSTSSPPATGNAPASRRFGGPWSAPSRPSPRSLVRPAGALAPRPYRKPSQAAGRAVDAHSRLLPTRRPPADGESSATIPSTPRPALGRSPGNWASPAVDFTRGAPPSSGPSSRTCGDDRHADKKALRRQARPSTDHARCRGRGHRVRGTEHLDDSLHDRSRDPADERPGHPRSLQREPPGAGGAGGRLRRSEEHTSE